MICNTTTLCAAAAKYETTKDQLTRHIGYKTSAAIEDRALAIPNVQHSLQAAAGPNL